MRPWLRTLFLVCTAAFDSVTTACYLHGTGGFVHALTVNICRGVRETCVHTQMKLQGLQIKLQMRGEKSFVPHPIVEIAIEAIRSLEGPLEILGSICFKTNTS